MNLFKKKIKYNQLVSNILNTQFELSEKNFDKWSDMADEFKVLNAADKKELWEWTQALIVTDIMISSGIYFSNNLSSEEAGRDVSSIYVQFLKQVKNLTNKECEKKSNRVFKMLEYIEKKVPFVQGSPDYKFNNDVEQTKFTICLAFSEIYSGVADGATLTNKKVEGKNFAAFKLAESILKSDVMGNLLKEYKVIFD